MPSDRIVGALRAADAVARLFQLDARDGRSGSLASTRSITSGRRSGAWRDDADARLDLDVPCNGCNCGAGEVWPRQASEHRTDGAVETTAAFRKRPSGTSQKKRATRPVAKRIAQVFEQRVEDRHGQQRQQQAERLPADHQHADGAVGGGAGAARNHQRNHAGHQRDGGHQNGPQAVAIGLDDGVVAVHTGFAQTVGVIDLQNRVLLDDAEQQQQARGRRRC